MKNKKSRVVETRRKTTLICCLGLGGYRINEQLALHSCARTRTSSQSLPTASTLNQNSEQTLNIKMKAGHSLWKRKERREKREEERRT